MPKAPRRRLREEYAQLKRAIEERVGDASPLSCLVEAAHRLDGELLAFIGRQEGINVSIEGLNALFYVAGSNDVAAARLLIDAGCQLNALQVGAPTPLMHAAFRNRPAIVRLLIERGADIGYTDKDGNSALSLAQERGHTEIVALLKSAVQ